MENSVTLPAITQEFFLIEEQLMNSDGEVTPEIQNKLQELHTKLIAKIDNYARVIHQFESQTEYWAAIAKRAATIASSLESSSEYLRNNVKTAMLASGQESIDGNLFRFSLRKSTSVDVKTQDALPPEFLITVPESKRPDKKRIGDALKSGIDVPGAVLVENKNLNISLSKGKK